MRQWDHIDRVMRVGTLQELQSVTTDFARASGFQHHGFAMKMLRPGSAAVSDYFYYHDFHNEWSTSYLSLPTPEVEENDSRILLARTGLPAVAWNCRAQTSYPSPLGRHHVVLQAKKLLQRAGDFGLRSGITVPSPSQGLKWGFMTFTHDHVVDPREMFPAIVSSMYFVNCLQASIDRLMRPGSTLPSLSPREQEVLRWCAVGKTSWEISVILRISERTVNFHVAQATRKLQVTGRQAACTRAVALGLITL